MAQDGEIFGAAIEAASRLILVHDDIEDPERAVLDAPMGPDDGSATLGGERKAEQITSRLGGGFGGGLADAGNLSNGGPVTNDGAGSRPATRTRQRNTS
jgi:hypothetical protein